LIPVLVGLGWDQDVQSAVNAVSDFRNRSRCLSKGADEYFRVRRNDVARKFDAEALRVVTSSPAGDPKQQEDHESALHNLALARAGHGDVPGALDIVAQLRVEKRVRDVTAYVARRAIDSGHGTAARPAIRAMEKQANAAQDAGLMLQAADDWYQAGEKQNAQRTLTLALKTARERQSTLDVGVAAELTWRLEGNGNAEAMLEIVDRLKVNDSRDMGRLVQIMTPVSPAVAVQLSGRLEVSSQIDSLANIAIHIAGAEK
jgi:hypothetical protein